MFQANLVCTRYDIVPLIKKLTELTNTVVIWQDTPPYPGRELLPTERIAQNSFIQAAINFYIAAELRRVGVKIVPAWTLTMPFADEELSGRTHMIDASKTQLLTIPPADVATYYGMSLACSKNEMLLS